MGRAAATHSLARFKKMVVNSTEEICLVFTRAAISKTCVTAVAGRFGLHETHAHTESMHRHRSGITPPDMQQP